MSANPSDQMPPLIIQKLVDSEFDFINGTTAKGSLIPVLFRNGRIPQVRLYATTRRKRGFLNSELAITVRLDNVVIGHD